VTKNSLSQSTDLRSTLLAERDTAAAGAATVARDLDQVKAASTLVATDDEHDPEGATIAFDRAQLTAVLDQARRRVAELDDALGRVSDGTYGTCTQCGEPIAAERLVARPAAATCIACASSPVN
jgi:RNA polymerase-binding transcription factor DksA